MADAPPVTFAGGRSVEYGSGDRSVCVCVSLSHAEGIVGSTPASYAIATSFHIPSNSLTTDRHYAVCVLTL